MWHSIRKCVRTVLVVLVYYLLISKDRSPVSPFLFFVVFTQEMQKMYKYVTAWAKHFSSGFYKLSLVTCMNVTSVCHAPGVISEHCVCGTQVHSGRVKRSSGKKHDELDLICHPCPEASHTHSVTRTRTNTHTTPHMHFMPSITPQTKLHTYCFPRDKDSWQKRRHDGSLSWTAVLYLKDTQRFIFISLGNFSFNFQLCLRCFSYMSNTNKNRHKWDNNRHTVRVLSCKMNMELFIYWELGTQYEKWAYQSFSQETYLDVSIYLSYSFFFKC